MHEKALCKDTQIEISCKALQSLTGLSHFKFARTDISGDTVVTEIESTLGYAFCPCCGKKSRSVHSHYMRHIRDLPLHGRRLEMIFRARRFRCRNPRCRQSVFTEQPPELAVRYGRRSTQERGVLLKMAVEESAMAASRVATLVGMPVSPSTVLRMVKGIWMAPDRASVTNIGIDDFALRKGMSYGTIVTDNDTGKPLEIILSRDADKVTECLKKYVNVKTVTRDRAGEYAKAVTDGIPTAIQIADRFHLVMNCGDNIKKQMRKSLKDIKDEIFRIDGTELMDVRNAPTERAKAKYRAVIELTEKGLSKVAIASLLQMKEATVGRYQSMSRPHGYAKYHFLNFEPHMSVIISGMKDGKIMKEIWQDLLDDGMKLCYERFLVCMKKMFPEYKCPRGHRRGSKVDNTAVMKRLKKEEAEHKDIQKPIIQANAVNPTKLYIYTCNPEYGVNKKTGECSKENIMYNDLIRRSAILSGLREVIQSFREVMKGKSTDSLDKWIAKFSKSSFHHISTFATFLLKDIDAVKNAIRFPYSNGLTEGINNKIKAIKRQMYGRAKTDLLATRLVASMAT